MIEFLQDYTTTSLPPEVFSKGDRKEREEASEQYLVRLGVAAFVVDGKLLDADYRPVSTEPVVVAVVETRGRALDSGRAGEPLLGLAAPQRASTGPGNAALFGGDQQTVGLQSRVEQLTADLDAAGIALRDAGEAHTGERDRLTGEVTRLTTAGQEAQPRIGELSQEVAAANERAQAAEQRAEQLERDLAEATKPKGEDGAGDQTGTDQTGDTADKPAAKRGK